MNIRSVSNPAQVLGKEKVEASKTIKSEDADEREANGQQPRGDTESHRPLTEEEVQQVMEKLRSHEGIQKNGLLVKHSRENDQNVVWLEAPDGKVIKRIVERDLYFYLFKDSKDELQLVNRSA